MPSSKTLQPPAYIPKEKSVTAVGPSASAIVAPLKYSHTSFLLVFFVDHRIVEKKK